MGLISYNGGTMPVSNSLLLDRRKDAGSCKVTCM
jgi:hypothetical protein